jgi:Flp pilus assembly pilin Flp
VRLGRRGFRDRSGQALVEYALLIALVAVALVGALILLRDAVGGVYAHTGNQIDQVTAAPADPALGGHGNGKGCGDGVGGGQAAGGCAVGPTK